MADQWERANGLNPNQNDAAQVRPSGYTAIEEYINELADQLVGELSDDKVFDDSFESIT